MHKHCAVFALLHHNKLRTVRKNAFACGHCVSHARQERGFAVVEYKSIHFAEQLHEFAVRDVDPEIHRVGDRDLALRELREQSSLHCGMGVAEENVLTICEHTRHD